MNVRLDPNHEKLVQELAEKSGRSPEEIVRELIGEALSHHENGMEGGEAVERQRVAWERLHKKLAHLPVQVRDGFTGRDHDKILYGGSK